MADDGGSSKGQGKGGSGGPPERDRWGFLQGRPWYRHPLVIITVAGVVAYLLNLYVAANRTGAGVPLFG